jgi:hypothetical protein
VTSPGPAGDPGADRPGPGAVSLDDGTPGPVAAAVAASIREVPGFGLDIEATLACAVEIGMRVPPPPGDARGRWEALATAAHADVAGARVLEPHLDALAILSDAQDEGWILAAELARVGVGAGSSWGVFAAEGRDTRLEARPGTDGLWSLSGVKPWCSLAESVSHALITAWTGPTERRLFAVAMRQPTVRPQSEGWVSRGLAQVRSTPVEFVDAVALPVGDDGWYLRREGFWWGGIGVAACWWGGALPLVEALADAAARPDADQFALSSYGAADARLWTARAALADAARDARASGDRTSHDHAAHDHAPAGRPPTRVTAERVRAIVAAAAEDALALADRALGPGPLASDEAHARRVSDLRMYLRQHHGERDLARLGGTLVRVRSDAGARPEGEGSR